MLLDKRLKVYALEMFFSLVVRCGAVTFRHLQIEKKLELFVR